MLPVLLFVIHLNLEMQTLCPPRYLTEIFTHLKLWLATATHNFEWVKITHYILSLFNFSANIVKFWSLNTHVIPNNSDFWSVN